MDPGTYVHPSTVRAFVQVNDIGDSAYANPLLILNAADDTSTILSSSFDSSGSLDMMRGYICLFDIKSVEKAGVMDLHPYPFAIPSKSFFVSLENGESFLFEASSDAAQKRIIIGIKEMVARLALNLILGNTDICSDLMDNKDVQGNNELAEHEISDTLNGMTNQLVNRVVWKCKRHQ